MSDKAQEAFEELEIWVMYVLLVLVDLMVLFGSYNIQRTALGVSVELSLDFGTFAALMIVKSQIILFVAIAVGAYGQRSRSGGQPGGSDGPAPGAARPPKEP